MRKQAKKRPQDALRAMFSTMSTAAATVFACVLTYTLLSGLLVFKIHVPVKTSMAYDVETLLASESEGTYAYLMEAPREAFDLRIALIEEAERTIDLSVFAIRDGFARDVLFGALLGAADRDVEVRLLIDGVYALPFTHESEKLDPLIHHENIDVKYFEPINLLTPYTIHNRLHDKLLIVDGIAGILGGRNIGDRYFGFVARPADATLDRDILVFEDEAQGALADMSAYFKKVFEHPYSVASTHSLGRHTSETVLRDAYEGYRKDAFETGVLNRVRANAVAVEAAVFLHSPLNRFIKEPVLLETFAALALEVDDVFVQSPYVILNRPMRRSLEGIGHADYTVLTNNAISNPNLYGAAGTKRYRDTLTAQTAYYEYHGASPMHAKTLLFGNELTVITTFNVDPRSAFLSTESALLIRSEAFNAHTRAVLVDMLSESVRIEEDGTVHVPEDTSLHSMTWRRRVELFFAGLIAYLFPEML